MKPYRILVILYVWLLFVSLQDARAQDKVHLSKQIQHADKAYLQSNFNKALHLYESDTTQLLAEHWYRLGKIYLSKQPFIDTLKAYNNFMHAANMGHADAMRNVGRIYAYSHIFTTSDRSQAMIWLNKSIELDNSDAYLDLSNLYREGIGTNKNDSLALEYAKKSALMGNEIGMYNTGLYYLEPQKHDVTSAMSWFKQAAALGDVHSMSMIGFLYLYGNANGLDPNIDSAQLYLQKAVDSGDSHSMSLLGLSYIQCDKDKQNHALARKWFYRAADSGNSQAMNFIGVMYELGVGVIRNCNESVYWYEKAIALKNTDAMVNYGIHFINGCTQTKDINETLKWFNKALELNPRSAFAHIELGDVYSNGKYLPKDLALAKTHYQAAVELGNVYAKKRLEKLTQ